MGLNGTTATASPYLLTVTPVNISLTAGTNIPPPVDSPPRSREGQQDNGTVTPGLSMPGAFPSSPAPERTHRAKISTSTVGTFHNADESLPRRNTATPSRGGMTPSIRAGRRRLFSLHSLRQSFGSSRTSLSLSQQHDSPERPPTSSGFSTAESTFGSSSRPQLRKKRSSSWFRRTSGFFTLNPETGLLDISPEEHREGKRFKESPPMLPEIQEIVPLDDGDLGWNEEMFKKPSSVDA